jgi:hypothetical protein
MVHARTQTKQLNDAIGALEAPQVMLGNTLSGKILGSLRWVRDQLFNSCPDQD